MPFSALPLVSTATNSSCCSAEGQPKVLTVNRGIFCTVAFVLLSQDSAMAAVFAASRGCYELSVCRLGRCRQLQY